MFVSLNLITFLLYCLILFGAVGFLHLQEWRLIVKKARGGKNKD